MSQKNNQNSLITGAKQRDQRDVLMGDGGKVPEPSRNLPPDIRMQYRYVQRLIRKSSKARSAISVGDQEAIVNVATSIAMQRELIELRKDPMLTTDQKMKLGRMIMQIGADIRQGLSQLLLTPNSRARVIVSEDPTNNLAGIMDMLRPPE